MAYMFYVRSSPCPAPNLQSRPPLYAACTAVARRLPPPGPYPSPRTACPPLDSPQGASAFNQPLSFDTSSVTTMTYMFRVRSSPCPARQSAVEPSLPHSAAASRPPGPHLAPHHMPSLRLGRAQTPCPTPTSCSSVASGRAPRPLPLLATARAGVREAARQTEALYIEGA
eukprot:scaffold41714_cov51-Phaeocystis_antarctica.AAC.2